MSKELTIEKIKGLLNQKWEDPVNKTPIESILTNLGLYIWEDDSEDAALTVAFLWNYITKRKNKNPVAFYNLYQLFQVLSKKYLEQAIYYFNEDEEFKNRNIESLKEWESLLNKFDA